ncbi:MAG: ATP-binding protein, partial [Ilumatobacteraceae bacterium]
MRVVGRDQETSWLAELIDGASTAAPSSVTTIEAVAGAGKSAVIALAAQLAEQEGVRVLRCQPSAAEAQYAYAALGDLLHTVPSLDAIEPVPRRALERALLRAEHDVAEQLDARAIGLGCAALWSDLAATQPLLLLIDDVHWLD